MKEIYFSLWASEDCLELCLEGLVVGRNYVWCLVIVVIFMGFREAGGKRCEELLKVIIQGGNVLKSLTKYYKRLYRIPLFIIFLLFNLFCI